MNIKIDKEYSLQSDERNVILVRTKKAKKGENTGKKYEENVGYYSTVQMALNDYLRVKTNLSEATSIPELLTEVEEVRKTIEKVLKGI